MKVLITGGAGFIGSHLAETLTKGGAHVVVADCLSTGNISNLQWKESHHSLEFVHTDISQAETMDRLIAQSDWVFHLAAEASVPFSVSHPLEAHTTNLEAAFRLLLSCKKAEVQRFVFASSSAVYGDAGALPVNEQHRISPLSPYGLQKYTVETYVRQFWQFYKFPGVALRFFNVYGPRQSSSSPYSGVIAKFCSALLKGERPKIFGDGSQCRDFVYVTDVVNALIASAELPVRAVAGESFNIATGQSMTLLELVSILENIVGVDLPPELHAPRPGDIKVSRADVAKAHRKLNWKAQTTRSEGLSHTVDFYRNSTPAKVL